MISNFQNDGYYTSDMLSKAIHHFFEISKNLPKEPKSKYKTDEFQNYQFKMQEYLTLYCCHLFDVCNKMNTVTEQFKEAYNKLYSDFKSYKKLITKKFKCISQANFEHNQDDGSMSPSNPCYTNFNNDNGMEYVKSNNFENNDQDLNLSYENFLNNFNEKHKVIKHFLKKEKRQIKIKKLTKSQKKKLRKKQKLQGETVANNLEQVHYNNNEEDPQAMIQNYFKSYNETGKWSWTDWVNSIQKIQQIYPQWYEMFNKFSNDMGIDWNGMFVSDLQAIDMLNVRIDMDNLDLTNKFIVKSPIGEIQKEGISVIFTDDVQSRDTTETAHSELFCDACNQRFRSARFFHIHLRGLKHVQNEIKYVSKQKPEIFLEEINRENASVMSDTNKEDKHMKWLLNNEDISKASGTFTCKLCNITCSSQKDFKSHLNGEKHSKNTNEEQITLLISDEKKVVNDKVISKPIKKPVARIQILLNQFTNPLIGLDYVNEYQKRDSLSDCWYYCELCNCKCDRKSIISHITSYKHRATYLKQNYYDLYELVEQDPSSKAVRMKRLEVYSEQVEIFEGRKKMNIMIEKLSISSPEIISNNSKPEQTDSKIDKVSVILNREETNSDTIKLTLANEFHLNLEDVDKEDGEIESSDDEFCCERKSENTSKRVITKSVSKQEIFVELEAGEIENEIIDVDVDSDEQSEQIETNVYETTIIDKAEFNNYEPLYVNNRIPPCAKNITRDNGPIEFMNHKEKKKVKLKEVSDDILNHFKQEAKWAFNRLKEINITQNIYHKRNLHLPPSKNPVGPVYPGVSELSNKPQLEQIKSSSTENRYMPPEADFSNTVERIETKLSSVNNSLLHDVQNMLVNKVTNDPLNEIIRQEFLFSSPNKEGDPTISSLSNEINRKSILSSPIDSKLLNETLETVQNFTEFSSNHAEICNLSDSMASKKTASNLEIGKKLSKHNEFLGMDQPPPPSFPKPNPDIYYKIPPFNPMANIMPPFLTPGMIEHQTIYSTYDRNYMYSFPYFPNSNNNSNHPPSDIFNGYDRTNL